MRQLLELLFLHLKRGVAAFLYGTVPQFIVKEMDGGSSSGGMYSISWDGTTTTGNVAIDPPAFIRAPFTDTING